MIRHFEQNARFVKSFTLKSRSRLRLAVFHSLVLSWPILENILGFHLC
jgi:hypothetical protein